MVKEIWRTNVGNGYCRDHKNVPTNKGNFKDMLLGVKTRSIITILTISALNIFSFNFFFSPKISLPNSASLSESYFLFCNFSACSCGFEYGNFLSHAVLPAIFLFVDFVWNLNE